MLYPITCWAIANGVHNQENAQYYLPYHFSRERVGSGDESHETKEPVDSYCTNAPNYVYMSSRSGRVTRYTFF